MSHVLPCDACKLASQWWSLIHSKTSSRRYSNDCSLLTILAKGTISQEKIPHSHSQSEPTIPRIISHRAEAHRQRNLHKNNIKRFAGFSRTSHQSHDIRATHIATEPSCSDLFDNSGEHNYVRSGKSSPSNPQPSHEGWNDARNCQSSINTSFWCRLLISKSHFGARNWWIGYFSCFKISSCIEDSSIYAIYLFLFECVTQSWDTTGQMLTRIQRFLFWNLL